MGDEEHDVRFPHSLSLTYANTNKQGASIAEQLIAACRGNNTDLLETILTDLPDDEITRLLNQTVTVMGNHLYHEAALRGNCSSSSLRSRFLLAE